MKSGQRKHEWQGADDSNKRPVKQEPVGREPMLQFLRSGGASRDTALGALALEYLRRASEWLPDWQRSLDRKLRESRRNPQLAEAYNELKPYCNMRQLRLEIALYTAPESRRATPEDLLRLAVDDAVQFQEEIRAVDTVITEQVLPTLKRLESSPTGGWFARMMHDRIGRESARLREYASLPVPRRAANRDWRLAAIEHAVRRASGKANHAALATLVTEGYRLHGIQGRLTAGALASKVSAVRQLLGDDADDILGMMAENIGRSIATNTESAA